MKNEVLDKILNSQKNIIATGDAVTGKTTQVIFPLVDKMINNQESLFIFDAKEEYLNNYYSKLVNNGYQIIILNLRDMNKSEGWNPLAYPYYLYQNKQKELAIDYVESLAKTIFVDNSEIDPFWNLSASDLFIGLVLGLFEDGQENEINISSIYEMLNKIKLNNNGNDDILTYFDLKKKTSAAYKYASSTILAPSDTKGGIVTVAKQKLRKFITRDSLNNLLSQTTFKMDEIGNKDLAIIFLGLDENKDFNTLASMFIDQAFKILLTKKDHQQFNFIIDNFDAIPNINNFNDYLGAAISRKIKFVIGTRSLTDVKNKYGDYYLKLCDLIDLNQVTINDTSKAIKMGKDPLIVYPKLKQIPFKVFDVKYFIIKNSSTISKQTITDNKKRIDALIQEIDDKIAELEKENALEEHK
jgi:type IV secretion system protein VirD4